MKILKRILLGMALLMLSACTNNGDIGPIYGQWLFDAVVVDGVEVPREDIQAYNVSFQGDIVQFRYSVSDHEVYSWTGNFTLSGSSLTIVIPDNSNITAYIPWISPGVNAFHCTLSSSKMAWQSPTIAADLRKNQ